MKTLVPEFEHKDNIQHSASAYNSKRRPAQGNLLYRVLRVSLEVKFGQSKGKQTVRNSPNILQLLCSVSART